MRSFLGIGLPAGVRETIVSAIRQVRDLHPPVAWTAPKNLHITLNFLGEILPERGPLVERLRRIQGSGPVPPPVAGGPSRGAPPPAWGARFVQALSGKTFGVVPVSSFTLYESRLGPGGAVYTPLCDFRLEGTGKREMREEKEP